MRVLTHKLIRNDYFALKHLDVNIYNHSLSLERCSKFNYNKMQRKYKEHFYGLWVTEGINMRVLTMKLIRHDASKLICIDILIFVNRVKLNNNAVRLTIVKYI